MLAQNFKTATDLGTRDADLNALITILGMLEREEFVHVGPDDVSKPNGFNMSPVIRRGECGTVACLAGWVEALNGETLSEDAMTREQSHAWGGLIMPSRGGWSKITPQQAAIALRSYLTTGDANWAEALASQP